MSDITLPSLTTDGALTDVHEILRKQFMYFMASDFSQSNMFYNSVYSLKYIMSTEKDEIGLSQALRTSLTNLYEAFFTNPSIIIDPVVTDSLIVLNVNVKVKVNGVDYELKGIIDNTLASASNYREALSAMLAKYDIV